MKFSKILFLPLLFSIFLLTNCQVYKNSGKESLFWEISGKDLDKPSYLFGTHHLMTGALLSSNPIIHKKLQQTELIAGEIRIDSSGALATAIAGLMDDTTLDNLLNKEDFIAIDKVLKEQTGYSLPMLNMFKPLTIYMLISNAKHIKSLDKDAPGKQFSMDEYFQQQAKQMGKPVIGLETMEEQINILYNVYPLERQLDLLKEVVYDKDNTMYADMVQINSLYKTQQTEKLYQVAKKNMLPKEYQVLLVDRNNAWITQLVESMPKQPMFVAVGAMHLAGTDGLLNQLRKRGYQVKPVKITLGR